MRALSLSSKFSDSDDVGQKIRGKSAGLLLISSTKLINLEFSKSLSYVPASNLWGAY